MIEGKAKAPEPEDVLEFVLKEVWIHIKIKK